ncbi:hypothetical protein CR513_50541, partial [Mucuna pruriens]
MKHPIEDHSIFGIDVIEELVEEYFQLNSCSEGIEDFVGSTDLISGIGSITKEANYKEVRDLPNSEDNHNDIADLDFEVELPKITKPTKRSRLKQPKAKIMSAHLVTRPNQEQEDKLLNVLRQHKKAIGWKLLDLPSINPSIYMHRILMEEEIKPIMQ